MAVLDGPRTLLPFAQIGNWKFLIDGFALYTVHLGWVKVAHLEVYRINGINRYEYGTFFTL